MCGFAFWQAGFLCGLKVIRVRRLEVPSSYRLRKKDDNAGRSNNFWSRV